MKKLLFFPLTVFLAFPVFATTPTSSSSIFGTERDADMLESQEEFEGADLEREDQWYQDEIEQERMEEIDSESGAIDYNDRTRTDRERKALNTSGDASDDQ